MIDGKAHGQELNVGSTSGWQAWKTMIIDLGSVTAGQHSIRIRNTGGAYNINWLNIVEDKPDDITIPLESETGLAQCDFHYGQDWLGTNHDYPEGLSYVRVWLGGQDSIGAHGRSMFENVKAGGILEGLTPMVIGYVIAFTARDMDDLQDCDVAEREGRTTSLCTHGTQFIRDNYELLKNRHRLMAREIAEVYGKTEPVLWMTEPDYFQYAEDEDDQLGGGFTYQEAGDVLRDFMETVRSELPNAVFALDTAPWLRERAARWFNAMPTDISSYLTLFGKPTPLIQNGSWSNSWKEFYQLSGLPILSEGWEYEDVDDWHNAGNINEMMSWGIVSESFRVPPKSWQNIIEDNKPQLIQPVTCKQ